MTTIAHGRNMFAQTPVLAAVLLPATLVITRADWRAESSRRQASPSIAEAEASAADVVECKF